ncbi:MAG: hypothetical protein ABIM30_05985 [candidate division WOR-3 bacterium]
MAKKHIAKKSISHNPTPNNSQQQSPVFWLAAITLAMVFLSLSVVLLYFEVHGILEQLANIHRNIEEIKQEASTSQFCMVETPHGKIYGVNERKAIPNCLEVIKNETQAYPN